MKKVLVFLLITIAAALMISLSCQQNKPSPEKLIARVLTMQVDSFAGICRSFELYATKDTGSKKMQQFFLQARSAYKNFEWAAEYFEPATSRFVNGAPVPEVEMQGQQIFQPQGLQVIETFLFPRYDTSKKRELIAQLNSLQSKCKTYKSHFENIDILDWQVFDAAKLEVFRLETLGITGFDNALSLNSMHECFTSLSSLQKVLQLYTDSITINTLNTNFNNAKEFLLKNNDFNSFNRAAFIKTCCNPLTINITNLEAQLKINVIKYNRLLNQDAKTLFDSNAFNVNAYAPDDSSFITDKKIALGQLLFADPVLSGNGNRSCQTCHQPQKAFTDGLIKNTEISSGKVLQRNTPTLINAALQPSQFYDLRVTTLEDQSRTVVQNILEMHGSMKLSVQKLWADTTYRKLFSEAFPKKNRTEIDTMEVMNAISSFVRNLTKLNSRFDDYMKGNETAMNAEEVNGFNLFMGKAKCATCHYMPLFNGTFPPRYVKTESEVIGVPQSLKESKIDDDFGRYNVIKTGSFKHAFKTPTLRNAARTAPYMHNGIFPTLQSVIDFYNNGGGTGLGISIENQTLPFDKLNLTQKEIDDITAFIKALDSK